MANLLPVIAKQQKSAIVKADKFLNTKTKTAKVGNVKTESPKLLEDTLTKIERKVIQIDKLLKDSLFLSKKEGEKKRKGEEQKEFEGREKELEKKKPEKIKGVDLPTPPKMGFLDWIKNFITQTILGFVAVRLIDYLPTLLSVLPTIIKVTDFITDVGGKMLDGLITFIDWGYKAYDATRGFIKKIGGDGLAQNFDKFGGALNGLLDAAIVVGLASLSMGGGDGGAGGRGGRRGFDSTGRRVGKEAQRRYAQRFGKDQFIDRFGKKNLRNLSGGMRRGAFQKGARAAFMGLAGKQGAKAVLKFVKPLVSRIPIIGGLIEFGLSWALGEPVGKAAFRGIGSVLVGAIGTVIGGPVGAFLGSWAGGEAGGVLYDMFFGNKNVKPKGKVAKAAGGGRPAIRGGKLTSGPARRTIKKKKKVRTVSFVPRKIKPGSSTGGEEKIQSVFPNPDKPSGLFGFLGGIFGGNNETPQKKVSNEKTSNPQEFLINSNNVLGKSNFFGPFFTIAIKTVLGQKPDFLDYKNAGRGLNSWMQQTFKSGPLGFAGGGEVDARQFFSGEDYTNIISKSVEDSVSREVNETVRDLAKEISLRPVGREETTTSSSPPPNELPSEQGATSGQGTSDTSLNPYRRAFLDTLAYAEGTANYPNTGYNTMFTGKQFSGFKDHPRKIQVSGRYRSDAAGRYQFLSTTWDGLGLPDFSPANQDKGALKLLAPHVLQAIDKGDFATAFHGARKTWASLPGAGYGQPEKKMKTLVGYANNRLEKYKKGQIGKPVDEPSGGLGPLPSGITSQKMRTGPSAYIGGSTAYHIDTKFHKSLGMGSMISAVDKLANAYSARGRKIEFSNAGVAGSVWNPKASSEEKRSLLQRAFDAHSHSRFMRSEGFLPFDYYIPKKNENRFGRSAEGAEILLPTFGGKVDVGTKYSGYGKSAEIYSGNKMVAMTGHGDIRYAFHGKVGIVPKDGMTLKLHKGEMFKVVDKDSVDLFGNELVEDIISIENRAQLVSRAPSIIEKLKTISGYTDYEMPYGSEPQIIEVPVEVPVPMPMGGGGSSMIAAGGGVNSTNDMFEQTLAQLG